MRKLSYLGFSIFAMVMFLSGFTLVNAYINWKGIHGEMGKLNEMTETEMRQYPYVQGNISAVIGPYCQEEVSLLRIIGIKDRYYLIPFLDETDKYMSIKMRSWTFLFQDKNVSEIEDYILKHGGRLPFQTVIQGRLTGISNGVQLYMGEAIQEMSGIRDDEKLKTMMAPYCIEATSDEEIKREILTGGVIFGGCLFFVILKIKTALRKRKLNKRWQQAIKASSPSS